MTLTPNALSEPDMEEIARLATQEALAEYQDRLPEDMAQLTLGTSTQGDEVIFELYIAGETAMDDQVISQAFVNKFTGDVRVDVHL